jgi:molybdopterin-containing oxidoreductase family iron-sulfur binding subunit
MVSPKTAAERFKWTHSDVDERHMPLVTIRRGNREIRGPLWISYGHPDDCVTVQLGFGRTRAGRVGGVAPDETFGHDAYKILTTDATGIAADAKIASDSNGETYGLACTQHHQMIDFTHRTDGPYAGENLNKNRGLVKVINYDDYKSGEYSTEAAKEHEPPSISLYPPYAYDTNGLHKWGMVIDQTACIGCQACVTACQSENNIAIVGKQQVIMQREMHWLRIDTYYTGDPAAPDMLLQPMLCQHCEQAPCEVVCPVAATSHSDEGINEMTYNRCVGTRYCSNNCPYKVRRFNFLQYNDNRIASFKLMRNPDVTVRNRGVMEKCTFCVQRVNLTRIELKKLDAEAIATEKDSPEATERVRNKQVDILAGLQTACQQACPTEAIVFGDMNKKKTRDRMLPVQRLKDQPEDVHYAVLADLNTHPRTTYLARFRNLNPALAPSVVAGHNA